MFTNGCMEFPRITHFCGVGLPWLYTTAKVSRSTTSRSRAVFVFAAPSLNFFSLYYNAKEKKCFNAHFNGMQCDIDNGIKLKVERMG